MTENDAQNGLSETAKGILARAGVDSQAGAASTGSVDGQTDLSKEMLVDVGGAKRTVKIADLVASFTEREKVAAHLKTAEERLAELGDLTPMRALKQSIEALDPRRRAKVLEILTGGDEDEGDVRESVRRAVRGEADEDHLEDGRRDLPPDVVERLERHERVLQMLAKDKVASVQQQKKQTIGEQVVAEMSQYPIFGNEAAAEMARDAIVTSVLHGEAKLDEAVRNAAVKLQRISDERRQQLNEEIGVPRTMVRQVRSDQLNANALKSGAIRRLALAELERLQGRN